ncbi:hypothetical protein [Nocardia wallacei]|uniref:hypothetical protein n=1 Tax=Nocardia wallacei TaxID=480035 RepID=UPI0024550AB4|nr:hypothetical protein [Nocardia wallacei]
MTDNTNTEPLDGEPEPDPAEALAAIINGRNTAIATADRWREIAATLTELRRTADGSAMRPDLPCGREEWYFTRRPALPFDILELNDELHALSGLITKAHTIAAVYSEHAVALDDDADELMADQAFVVSQKELEDEIRLNQVTPAELAAIQRETAEDEAESDRLEAEHRARKVSPYVGNSMADDQYTQDVLRAMKPRYTPEQIAAAERVARAHAIVADHRNHEPTDDGENWSAWNDSFQAADNERAAADKAYAALFAPGRVPDARTVLGQ